MRLKSIAAKRARRLGPLPRLSEDDLDNPRRLREIFRWGNDVLMLDSEPISCLTTADFSEWYDNLTKAAWRIPGDVDTVAEFEARKEDVCSCLRIVDFQASWFVLRSFMMEADIRAMDGQERMGAFHNLLRRNPDRFPFASRQTEAHTAFSRLCDGTGIRE